MHIDLSFEDLMKLAANCALDKNGVTITVTRPVLPEINYNPEGPSTVIFHLEKTDSPSK